MELVVLWFRDSLHAGNIGDSLFDFGWETEMGVAI